ncbi:MAG: type III secretion system chaperone [Planctomycetaceae bacterium]
MKLGIRHWILFGVFAALLAAMPNAASAQSTRPGAVNEATLGQLITAMGLKPEKVEQRYDFAFKARLEDEEWQLSMSCVLSQDEEWVWIMAWLDELPTKAEDVPRTALLRLLAENDRLGNGKFFAYIPANRRFVLQKVVLNEDMTTARFQEMLKDLGATVVESYPQWATANWKQPTADPAQTATSPAGTTAPR